MLNSHAYGNCQSGRQRLGCPSGRDPESARRSESMSETETNGQITELLKQAQSGDPGAHDALLTAVYGELKQLSRAQRRQGNDQTLSTTALVHEAYLKLVGADKVSWPDRRHFFAYAAKAMRSILVDKARNNMALKRGADLERVTLEQVSEAAPDSVVDLLALNDVLTKVAEIDARIAEVIELHVFGGLEFTQIAACLGLGERSVYRDWQKGRMLIDSLLHG